MAHSRGAYKLAQKFASRMVVGILVAILGGQWLDQTLGSGPWIMLALLTYVVFGSLYLLVIEAQKDGK